MGCDRGCAGSLYYCRIERVTDKVAKAFAHADRAVKHWSLMDYCPLLLYQKLKTPFQREDRSGCARSALAAVVTKLL